ncbi:hypothetical protein B0H10DRAFT_1960587 [Mycena sp. CBHHK59/15]|nr:hypothetical protein B0H10DRAFT_1960587 [Mycena sp. CBHHK59/15]
MDAGMPVLPGGMFSVSDTSSGQEWVLVRVGHGQGQTWARVGAGGAGAGRCGWGRHRGEGDGGIREQTGCMCQGKGGHWALGRAWVLQTGMDMGATDGCGHQGEGRCEAQAVGICVALGHIGVCRVPWHGHYADADGAQAWVSARGWALQTGKGVGVRAGTDVGVSASRAQAGHGWGMVLRRQGPMWALGRGWEQTSGRGQAWMGHGQGMGAAQTGCNTGAQTSGQGQTSMLGAWALHRQGATWASGRGRVWTSRRGQARVRHRWGMGTVQTGGVWVLQTGMGTADRCGHGDADWCGHCTLQPGVVGAMVGADISEGQCGWGVGGWHLCGVGAQVLCRWARMLGRAQAWMSGRAWALQMGMGIVVRAGMDVGASTSMDVRENAREDVGQA